MNNVSIITTADGSQTLYVPEFNEHYHSTNGALQESLHVFIDAGFRYACRSKNKRPLHILEIGFGTGLNALLTFMEAEKEQIEIYYEAIEKFPLPADTIQQLNYGQILPEKTSALFEALHNAVWETLTPLVEHRAGRYSIHKKSIDLLSYLPDKQFDLIYFDAFAPTVQPELWSEAIFQKLYNALNEGGVLVTYSSKGTVKQALRAAGFLLERLPGAAGKRHMLRALKIDNVNLKMENNGDR